MAEGYGIKTCKVKDGNYNIELVVMSLKIVDNRYIIFVFEPFVYKNDLAE